MNPVILKACVGRLDKGMRICVRGHFLLSARSLRFHSLPGGVYPRKIRLVAMETDVRARAHNECLGVKTLWFYGHFELI